MRSEVSCREQQGDFLELPLSACQSSFREMFTLSSAVRRTDTDDGGILLDIRHGKMFCLNVVGARIIGLLQTGCDEGRIAADISREYAIEIGAARADVHEFIATLNRLHIVEVRGNEGVI